MKNKHLIQKPINLFLLGLILFFALLPLLLIISVLIAFFCWVSMEWGIFTFIANRCHYFPYTTFVWISLWLLVPFWGALLIYVQILSWKAYMKSSPYGWAKLVANIKTDKLWFYLIIILQIVLIIWFCKSNFNEFQKGVLQIINYFF